MEATQNRATRKLIGYLAASAFAAVLGLGAHDALADCVTPSGTAFTASSSNVSFKLGTATVTCTASSTSGTTPAACGTPLCVTVSNPTFTGCKVNASGFTFNATLTSNSTNGPWQFCLAATGPTGSLKIPAGGVHSSASVLGATCTATSGAATTVSGPWSNTTSSVVFTNQSVPVTTTGGFPCPSATTASFSGTFTSSPSLTVTP